MELPNEIKARVIQGRIAQLEQEKYGLALDHEIQVFLGTSPARVLEIEAGIGNCIKAIKLMQSKLAELDTPTVEHVNGKEIETAKIT